MSFIPPRIACLSQKGGGGKTTMATNLAVAAAASGAQTLLVDLDPQQSSVRAWANWRAKAKARTKAPLVAQAMGWDQLEPALRDAGKAKHKLIVLDTPGTKGNVMNYAAGVSNVVLVTVQPSMLDLATISETLGLNNVMNRPAFVVFNRVTDKAALKDAQEVVAGKGYKFAPVSLSNLAAYRDAAGEGLGVLEMKLPASASKALANDLAKAKREIADLYDWVGQQIAAHPTVSGRHAADKWGER